MKERTSNLSVTAFIAGVMSLITIFGGITVFLGIFFAFFGILAGSRGKRHQRTRFAEWAVIISVLGLILCLSVALIFVGLYVVGVFGSDIDFLDIDFRYYFDALKEKTVNFIRQYI